MVMIEPTVRIVHPISAISTGKSDIAKIGNTGKKAAEELKTAAEKLEKVIRKAVGNDKLRVKLENLRDKKTASMLTVDEQSRRMADMMKMYAASGMAIMVITSDMHELIGISDRIYIMREGNLVTEVHDKKDMEQEKLLAYFLDTEVSDNN